MHKINCDSLNWLFFFTEKNIAIKNDEFLMSIYNKYKNDDGFLYIYVSTIETFGFI